MRKKVQESETEREQVRASPIEGMSHAKEARVAGLRQEPVQSLHIVCLALQKQLLQGAKHETRNTEQKRAACPVSICHTTDAVFAEQAFGQGSQ